MVQTLVKQLPLRAGLVKENGGLWKDFKILLPHPLCPAESRRGLPHLHPHSGNLMRLQEEKLIQVWEPPKTGPPRSFQFANLFTQSPQQFVNYSLGFSTLVPVSAEASVLGKLELSVFIYLSLQFWGHWFALGPAFSEGSK